MKRLQICGYNSNFETTQHSGALHCMCMYMPEIKNTGYQSGVTVWFIKVMRPVS